MTLAIVRHVEFHKLTAAQKSSIKKKLQQRKKDLQARLSDVSKALNHAARQSTRRPTRRRRHR